MTNKIVTALIAWLMLTGVSQATTITIDFSSLPSAQGWLFEHATTGSHASTTEAGMMSLNGGVLTGNTLGSGLVSPSGAGYNNYTQLSDSDPWQLTWTMRVLEIETNPGYVPPAGYWGVFHLVNNGHIEIGLGYGGDGISLIDGPGASIEVSLNIFDYHTYQLNFTPGGTDGLGLWNLYIDSAHAASGAGREYSRASGLSFGDGTGAANAAWEMTEYRFTQASSVPVPGSGLLLVSGLLGIFCAVRRQLRCSPYLSPTRKTPIGYGIFFTYRLPRSL